MSKHKNFKINRNQTPPIMAAHIQIGDLFEKEGSLHMRIYRDGLNAQTKSDEIVIVNLVNGEVSTVHDQQVYVQISDCEINYKVL